ncbi:MAG TPA: L-lactate dehydrogenase [Candidatus Acidoferrales bacterium]|nr:L-lactate dehydrogenase [Candidatus Acidoferrales bacterium]
MSSPSRVAIVGLGNVGASFAYALLISGLAPEIVLIDANQKKAEGEAMDLNHAVPFLRPVRVWAGDYADCAGAAVTVICAGAAQRPGETRLDLIGKNARIFASIVPEVVRHNPNGIILIATNPVDVLTYAAWKLSGLDSSRVFGSGTILDTARFRYLLSQHYDVDARSVHGFIIGEHGDSEVPVWSLTNIAGMNLRDYSARQNIPHDDEILKDIFQQTRDAAYKIIDCKGATYYAVASGLVKIVEAILRDQSTVLSVSSLLHGEYGIQDVCLSLPTVVHRSGVERVLELPLAPDEEAALRASAAVLHQSIESLRDTLPK